MTLDLDLDFGLKSGFAGTYLAIGEILKKNGTGRHLAGLRRSQGREIAAEMP